MCTRSQVCAVWSHRLALAPHSHTLALPVNRVEKGLQYAYVGRKHKKRDMRKLWIQQVTLSACSVWRMSPQPPLPRQLNAGSRQHGLKYSALIPALQKAEIELNRKVLADLAITEPGSFKAVIETAKVVSSAPVELVE